MKKGQLELAESGTVFLDEIGEFAPALQVKLLRVREFTRASDRPRSDEPHILAERVRDRSSDWFNQL